MKKKLGPLPVWAWAAIAAGVIAFIIYRERSASSSSSSASSNLNQVDPSNPLGLTYAQENADIAAGIDPNTGQTYASEQAAADADQSDDGSSGGGGDSSGDDSDDTAELQQIDSDLNSGFTTLSTQISNGQGLTDDTSPGQSFLGEVQDVTGTFGALGISLGVSTPATAGSASSSSGAGTITTHEGGAFYNWYKSVTGKAPPATVPVTNLLYVAWKAGKTVAQGKDIYGTGSGAAGSSGGSKNVSTTVKNTSTSKGKSSVASGGTKLTSGKKS